MPKTTPRSRSSSDDPGVESPDHHDRRRRKTGCKSFRLASGNQRKQNADRRGSTCCTVRRSAHPAGRARLSAFHGGSALGTHASQGAARTRFRGAGALVAGVSRRRQPRFQRAPRTPVIVPADMMSDTARAQRGRTLCARAPHPAPASRSHRLTSLHEEREDGAFIPSARQVKPNHSACASI